MKNVCINEHFCVPRDENCRSNIHSEKGIIPVWTEELLKTFSIPLVATGKTGEIICRSKGFPN